MTTVGFGVSNKATKGRKKSGATVDLEVKLQRTESLPFNTTMMVHHDNRHRSFPSNSGVGPTDGRDSSIASDIYDVVGRGGVCGVVAAAGAFTSGVAVGARTLQPFDISPTESSTTALKFPGGIMATSLGFPFTNAQWKELERQAMIYKYMMASTPVPPHLLIPTFKNLPPGLVAPHSPLGSCLSLRFTGGADLEPGRCRRTDGKKWRCSRNVAPDQKYCERHMHRGRPRSRKHVELHAHKNISNTNTNTNIINNKKTRHNPATSAAESPVTVVNSNPTVSNNGFVSQFVGSVSQTYLATPVFLDKTSDKVATFDEGVAFASTYKEPRSLDWIMKEEPVPITTTDEQWHHMVETEIGLATDSSFNNASALNQHYQEEEPLNLNSFGGFSSGEDQASNQCMDCTVLLNGTAKCFIDAWSNGSSSNNHIAPNSINTSSMSSNGKLSLSSLNLSMGGNNSVEDEMGGIQMSLGPMESVQNHGCGAAATPGGPLAEVLQVSTVTTTSSQISPLAKDGDFDSPPMTTLSAPSGILQKTLASFSDNSSSNSSPTTLASAGAKNEIALLWLNQGKL